ncbi:MAG: T9SS type A sorting domain-containing protein [Saprospiraceae bacterium]
MLRFLITLPFFFFEAGQLFAQPSIQWQKALGGNSIEEANSIQQTNDGGYVMAGLARYNNGDVSGVHGETDFWVVKLNNAGQVQWQKALGGSAYDIAYSVKSTNDEGYVVVGLTYSNDGDVTGIHGDSDFWVVKLTNHGAIQWQKALGGSGEDVARSVQQTTDGGYIVAGWSYSNDGDAVGNTGYHYWVVKLNNLGALEWQKSYGGSGGENAHCVVQTSDGGYVVAGQTFSNDGDVSGSHGGSEYWVVKLSSLGDIQWQKALGGCCIEQAFSIVQTSDGGYAVVGTTGSYNSGQVSGGYGLFDCWVVKLNDTGDLQWQKALGGNSEDYGSSIMQTDDGGYIVGGTTYSIDGDVTDNDGGVDYWILKLNSDGDLQWQKTLGGSDTEISSGVQQTSDGGYVICGYSHSYDGDVTGFHGARDAWIVKLSPESSPTTTVPSVPLEIFPNPGSGLITLSLPGEPSSLTLSISDLLGRELSRQTIAPGDPVDTSTLVNGFYLLTATTPSGKVFSGKFRKQE